MPRSQASASNGSAQLSVRTDEDLKREYKTALDAEGKSMSDDLREHMKRKVAEHGGNVGRDDHLPADDDLATAYVRLDELASPDKRRVPVEVAKSDLADKLNLKAALVRSNVLDPLKRRGYIRPLYNGSVRVATPEELADE